MKEKIDEILANQGKQLEVDAIVKAMENSKEIPEPETIERMKEELFEKQRDKYLSQEEERIEANKKYTQTYREEIEKEQQKRIEENRRKRKMEKAIESYEKHRLHLIPEEQPEKVNVKNSFFRNLKQFLSSIFTKQTEILKEENKPKTHRQFQEELREKNEGETKTLKKVEVQKIKDMQR